MRYIVVLPCGKSCDFEANVASIVTPDPRVAPPAWCVPADGKATPFALWNLEPRGTLFAKPGQAVYNGMIVGEHSKEGDLEVTSPTWPVLVLLWL